jgi:hypothetical protein
MTIRKMTPQEIAEWEARKKQQKRWSRQADRRHAVKGFLVFAVILGLLILGHLAHIRL